MPSFTIAPTSLTLAVGETALLQKTPDSNGIKFDCGPCQIARVERGSGLVTGLQEGVQLITARWGNQVMEIPVTVVAAQAPPPDPDPPPPEPDPDPPPPLPPPPTGSSYFDALAADPRTLLAAPLRSQVDIDQYVAGTAGANWLYSPSMNAAAGTVRTSTPDGRDADVKPQLRFPVRQVDGTVTAIWDSYKGAEWVGKMGLPSKTFMWRSAGKSIYYEIRNHFYKTLAPADLALVDVRAYSLPGPGAYRGPTNPDGVETGDGSATVQPIPQKTYVPTAQWCRYVSHVELNVDGHDYFSLWVIRPGLVLQVHDRVPLEQKGGLDFFAFHYDSSSADESPAGSVVTYDRHVWIGRGLTVAEATALAVDTEL